MSQYEYRAGRVDYIMGMLAFHKPQVSETWPIQTAYDVFADLSKAHPNIFHDIWFSKRGEYIYSKELEKIFFFLGASGIMTISGDFYHYDVSSATKKNIKKDLEGSLNEEEIKLCKTLAKEFRKGLKQHTSGKTTPSAHVEYY